MTLLFDLDIDLPEGTERKFCCNTEGDEPTFFIEGVFKASPPPEFLFYYNCLICLRKGLFTPALEI